MGRNGQFVIAASLTVLALGGAGAAAQSIRQQQAFARDRAQMTERMARANRDCGSNVALSVDWNSFADVKTSPQNRNDQDAYSYIANVSDAMDAVCRSGPEGKATIASQLRTIMVTHTASEQMSYSAGVLRYGASYAGPGYDKLQAYMTDTIGGGGSGASTAGRAGRSEPVKAATDKLRQILKF